MRRISLSVSVAGDDALQVVGGVGAQDLLVRDRARRHGALPGRRCPSSRDPLAQHRVLDHREAVALRQGQHEVVAVEDLHCCLASLVHGANVVHAAGRNRKSFHKTVGARVVASQLRGRMDDSAQQRLFAETPGSIEPPEEGLYLGTSGWSYADWEGTLYPEAPPSGVEARRVRQALRDRGDRLDLLRHPAPLDRGEVA